MRCSHPVLKVQRSAVQPNRKKGLIGPPQPTAVPEHPLREEVLEHLEEWGYRDRGDSFGELALRDGALRRLEEAIYLEHGDGVAYRANRVDRTELPAAHVSSASDREHPLWDRELDG